MLGKIQINTIVILCNLACNRHLKIQTRLDFKCLSDSNGRSEL